MIGIAPDVRLSEPLDDGQRWILENAHGEKIGVSADVATIITAMRDSTDLDEVNRRFGKDNVRKVIDLLSGFHVFLNEEPKPGHKDAPAYFQKGRLMVVSPASIQFTILRNPSRIFTPFAHFGRTQWLAAAYGSAFLAFAGVAAVFADFGSFTSDLASPQPLGNYLLLLLSMVLIVSLHEYAHGAVLYSFGGTVSRMGIMLLYLSPAFFCDVSDGWRLSRNKRVAVSLAGIFSTFMLAGVCSLLRLVLPLPEFMAPLIVGLYVGAIVNAIPTIKFDGYIALMSWKNKPFLRDKAMHAWKDGFVHWLTGTTQTMHAPDDLHNHASAEMRVYGLLCSFTPMILIYSLYASCINVLGLSTAGLLLCTILPWLLFAIALRTAASLLRQAFVHRRNPMTLTIRTAMTAMIACAVLCLFPVSQSRSASYYNNQNGTISITPLSGEQLPVGTKLTAKQQGLLGSKTVGSATITGEPTDGDVPVGTYTPSIVWDSDQLVNRRIQSAHWDTGKASPQQPIGVVFWTTRHANIAHWLWNQMVTLPLGPFLH